MKSSLVSIAFASLAAAVPTPYAASPKNDNSVDYSGVNWDKVDYSGVDWSKVDYSGVDWDKVDYSGVDWSKVGYNTDHKDDDKSACPPQQFFTSTWHVSATPGEVVNGTAPTGGLAGSSSTFWLGIRSDLNLICYDITLSHFDDEYQSPALTATHIHEAARGASGPPRVVFPDPTGDGDVRRSAGCMQGPFKTGVMNNGEDAGEAFHVSSIEANPARFYVDIHSRKAVPGAVRGQFA